MSRLRRPCSPSAASPPLEDDDLLREILLRLPPQPSSLPRASAVCRRWRVLVSDPRFLRRFRLHHRRSPPLLGFFIENATLRPDPSFHPALDPPNRAPLRPFSFLQPEPEGAFFRFLSCRHGLALILLRNRNQVLVWDPVTGTQHRIAVPPGFETAPTAPANGAVVRAAAGDAHHFQVVLLIGTCQEQQHTRVMVARVYSSETGLWSTTVSTSLSSGTDIWGGRMGSVLVGNSLYWLLSEKSSVGILELDLDRQSLARIHVPPLDDGCRFTVMRAEGGGLGFLSLSGYDAQLWSRERDSDGVVSWALTRTIDLGKLLSAKPEKDILPPVIKGFAEHNNVLFLVTCAGDFMIQLDSMQFKKLPGTNFMAVYHPFESVYTAGSGSEHDGGGLLHNT